MIVTTLDLKLISEYLRGKLLSIHMTRDNVEGVSGSNLGQTQCHLLSGCGCFLSYRSQYRLYIAWTLNKEQKNSTN